MRCQDTPLTEGNRCRGFGLLLHDESATLSLLQWQEGLRTDCMSSCRLDHLVVAALSLEEGAEYIRHALGVDAQEGGVHVGMGSHNALLRLGETTYLEVIAINPEEGEPDRPRLFGLDGFDAAPRLITWVARTDDVHAAVRRSAIPFGAIIPMKRGALEWSITIPEDGSMPLDGIAPTLIQWQCASHPAGRLDDVDCRLVGLEGFHPEAAQLDAVLRAIGFEGDFRVSPLGVGEEPYLVAHIRTPNGMCQLGAPQ